MESQEMTKKNWFNVILLGLGFLLLFSAFQTSAFVQTITISSFLSPDCGQNGSDGGIHISENFANRIGYISLCIIYLMVAITNWLSVSVVAIVGAKWSLVVSGALYIIYIAALVRPYVPVVFFGAFILGTGGGVLWTAQGQILIQNSSKKRMPTTSGVFWFMLQLSLVFGNLFFFLLLFFLERKKKKGEDDNKCIPHSDNYTIFGALTVVAIVGVISMCFLRPVYRKQSSSGSSSQTRALNTAEEEKTLLSEHTRDKPPKGLLSLVIEPIVNAGKMLITQDMLLLSICFMYTGYELNFWSGVYGTVIGNTKRFHFYSIGLAGLFIGLGEIAGGGLFGIFGHYTNKWGRDPIVLLGMFTHFATFLLIFYNLPVQAISSSVSREDSYGYIFDPSNIYIAMLCAFLLGFGDSCFNTQIYSLIGVLYPTDDRSAPAMALYKFFQSLAAFVGFLTSALIQLHWQLLVLTILATAGTITFAIVEWKHYTPATKSLVVAREEDTKHSL